MVELFLLKRSTKSLASHLQLLSRFDMPKTRVQKNKYAREWRKSTYEEKRFNKPLRQFLELKYRDVFNEYNWFYRSLNDQYPAAKDLTKTKVFKAWKSRQLNCESSDDEPPESEHTETERNETEPDEAGRSETEVNQTERNETEPDEAGRSETEPVAEQIETESTDPLTAAMQETLPPYIENMSIDQAENIIQQIIYELQQDDAAQGIFNDGEVTQDNDEGIDLDIETELEGIVEPFDYELEVEGIDY